MTKIYHFDNIKKTNFCIQNNITIEWENDVHTEFQSFNYLKKNSIDLPLSYIAYPWALLIDYYHKFKNDFTNFFEFLKELNLIEQLRDKNDFSISVIQSYHFKKYLPFFKKIGIKYLFSPHITKEDYLEIFYQFDIIILPYYLFPSVVPDYNINSNKKYLYCFIGNVNYNSEKPSEIRKKIINLKHPENTFVKKLEEWHFNDSIYVNQLNIIKKNTNEDDIFSKKNVRETEYKKIMEQSIYSLCPLGIGPNSIRLWESFAYNSIPISISDNLWLPYYLDEDFNNLIINIKENEIEKILDLSNNNINKNTLEFYKKYLLKGKFGSIIPLFFKRQRKINLLIPWYNISNEERYIEIHRCLENNLKNKHINKIYLFYESENIADINYEKYNNPKIEIIPVITPNKRDISFNRIARYSNKYLFDDLCIISNNDIFFDNTLKLVHTLDFIKCNYFISLTRKNCDNYLDHNNNIWKPHSASQDSWIYLSPIKLMDNEINLGWIQCDNIISESYSSLNYNVINPHYSINSWHLHKTNNTKFILENYNYNYKYKMKKIKLESLKDIGKKNYLFKFEEKKSESIYDSNIKNKININKLSSLKKKWKQNNTFKEA